MKKKQPFRRRKRLGAEIERLALIDDFRAEELATYGRERTETEKTVHRYLDFKKSWTEIYSKWLEPERTQIALRCGQNAIELCEMLLGALRRDDGKLIKQITLAMEQKEREQTRPPEDRSNAKDAMRLELLMLKGVCESTGARFSRKQRAILVKPWKEEMNLKNKPTGKRAPQGPDKTVDAIWKKIGGPTMKTGRPKKVVK